MKYYYDTEFLEGTQERPLILKGRRGNWMIGRQKPTIDLISIGIVSEHRDSFSKRQGLSDRTFGLREYYAISKEFNLKEAWNRFQWETEEPLAEVKSRQTGMSQTILRETIRRMIPKKVYWIRENVLYPIFAELFQKENPEVWAEDFGNMGNFKGYFERYGTGYKRFKELLQKYGKTNKQIAEEVKDFIYEKSTMLPSGKMSPIEILGSDKSPIELYGYYSAYDHVVFCWLFGKMIDLPKGFPMYTKDLKQLFDEKASSFTRSDFFTAVDFLDKGLPELSLEEKINHFKMHVRYPKQENEHNALADARWNKKLHEFINSI